MASTPLYKFLKNNGNTFYAFPGAAEDISAAYQNSNYKMYFSKFVLLNFPKQNTNINSGDPVVMDFENTFKRSSNSNTTGPLNESIVESLRNYVANHEVVMRESRLSNTKYYYDTNSLETPTEKIFFKWAKKLNLIDLEPAIPEDEYFSNIDEFKRKNINDDEYLPEYLWRERELVTWNINKFYESGTPGYTNKMEIEFSSKTNFRVDDTIEITGVTDPTLQGVLQLDSEEDVTKRKIIHIIPADALSGDRIIIDINFTGSYNQPDATAILVYNKFIQYIGEITGISNVQEANRNYTEVQAHIPDHVGSTPDILFRTMIDDNYKPNLSFPILPNQYQPEIMGSELFTSPIVSSPQNYPGSYFAQYDSDNFTYEVSTGDSIRRKGKYFGVDGDINNPIVNPSDIDGLCLDFNKDHYVKMNIYNKILTNFDQFNALEVNNQPPKDFEFNAILWYYTVQKTDVDGNTKKIDNLYGISFLDNPNNNLVEDEKGLRFPVYPKLVSNGNQDGTSYAFSLNLNFNIINDNPQPAYNPEAINSLFSMNLFNKAMSRLASTNDSFNNLIAEQGDIKDQLQNLKQLLYTQTDIATINSKINTLENFLKMYKSNQLVSSDTIEVTTNPGTPVTISLENIETSYGQISNIYSGNLYDANGIIPLNYPIPTNKNTLLNIVNNDTVNIDLNDKLTIVFSKDLDYRQSVDILITAESSASQNKKLDIFIDSTVPSNDNNSLSTTETLLIGDINMPVYFNEISSLPNSAYLWSDFKFNIDFTKDITYINNIMQIPLDNALIMVNSIKPGDTLVLNNFFLGVTSIHDYSGQYLVDSVSGSNIGLNISNNIYLKDYLDDINNYTKPNTIHDTINNTTMLSNIPYFTLNKGHKIRITRINGNNNIPISDKYKIEIMDLKF
jgi:hypothetical protein